MQVFSCQFSLSVVNASSDDLARSDLVATTAATVGGAQETPEVLKEGESFLSLPFADAVAKGVLSRIPVNELDSFKPCAIRLTIYHEGSYTMNCRCESYAGN